MHLLGLLTWVINLANSCIFITETLPPMGDDFKSCFPGGLAVQFAGTSAEESPLPSDFYCLYNFHKGLVSLVISWVSWVPIIQFFSNRESLLWEETAMHFLRAVFSHFTKGKARSSVWDFLLFHSKNSLLTIFLWTLPQRHSTHQYVVVLFLFD